MFEKAENNWAAYVPDLPGYITTGATLEEAEPLPDAIEQAKVAIQKQCPDCNPAYFAEWGKRMMARLKVDEFVNTAARAYEKRLTDDELTELLAVVSSQRTEKPVPLSPALQKKLSDLMPAIMGEIVGGCTEIGAKLGGEIASRYRKGTPGIPSPETEV